MSESTSSKEQENKFDLRQFNKEFIKKKEETKLDNRIKSQRKLDYLAEQANKEEKAIYDQSVWEILVGIKDTWFNILDDVLAGKIGIELFTKDNRLFYIGLTIIIITLILYLYNFFIDDEEDEIEIKSPEKKIIIEKHYIYKDKNDFPNSKQTNLENTNTNTNTNENKIKIKDVNEIVNE